MQTLTIFIYLFLVALFVLGIYGMLERPNLIKKLMSMNIMQVAVIAFFLVGGQKIGATFPILTQELSSAAHYVNPLPHALMLTAIVVSLSTTGVALALMLKIKDHYGDLEEPNLFRAMEEEEE